MDLQNSVLFILLMLALLLISWLLGYYSRNRKAGEYKQAPDVDYFVGLNYLLNDEPDDAIDVFIDALEINSSTFDTHLALGKLLKRRGKVDKAIAHFQSMLAMQKFNSRQVGQIKIQLIRSYIAAGLLDRAESLLEELKQDHAFFRQDALALSVMVHQIQKDWQLALDDAYELLKLTPLQRRHELLMQASHFHCEMAESQILHGKLDDARSGIMKAMNLFKGNVRVYMLLARIEFLSENPGEAALVLQKALQIEPIYFGEILPELRKCLQAAGRGPDLPVLEEHYRDLREDSDYLVELGRLKLQTMGKDPAIQHFVDNLHQAPSIELLEHAMRLAAEQRIMQSEVLHLGATVLGRHLDNNPGYRCENCGFHLKNLHWSCPGCNCWGLVKPINNLIPPPTEKSKEE